MKIFLKYFSTPLVIAVIASVLFILDSLIAPLFVEGANFMWIAFAIWTVFYVSSFTDKIKGFIGIIIGYLSATIMFLISSSFNFSVLTVSISSLIAVFLINFLVMYLDHAKKIWLNSLSGVFAGIFLTFSGLGKGLSPITNLNSFFLMLGIIGVYSVLGLLCGVCSSLVSTKSKEKLEKLEQNSNNTLKR